MLQDTDKKLATALCQADSKKRLAAYAAVGFAFAQQYAKEFGIINKNESKLAVKEIAYKLNELAIIDKDSLYAIMTSMVDFKRVTSSDRSDSVGSATGFMDLMSIEQHFSKNLMDSVDGEMDLFRSTVQYFNNWFKENIDY
jgi:hypothetical protein